MDKKSVFWLSLSILFLIYSVIVFMVGSGTFSFTIWIAAAFFCGIAYFLSRKDRWKKLPGAVRAIILIIIACGALYFVICQILIFSHFNDKGTKDLDYIIVLGAQMRESGPGVVFKYRLDAAYDYLSENPGTVCIVSGAKGSNETVSEGVGGRDYLISLGIDENRVLAEERAVDTRRNIANSFEMIDQLEGSDRSLDIGIVTSNFHLFRGLGLARARTDNVIYGIAAYTKPLYLPNNLVRECFGILRDIPAMR